MTKFLLDSYCMIAIVAPRHPLHADATAEWIKRVRKEQPVMAAPCWSESLSVLTRLPPEHRIEPKQAWDSLWQNWGQFPTVALQAAEWLTTLATCAEQNLGGGRIYDELIAACARKARVDTLITANAKHFAQHADWFAICVPGAKS